MKNYDNTPQTRTELFNKHLNIDNIKALDKKSLGILLGIVIILCIISSAIAYNCGHNALVSEVIEKEKARITSETITENEKLQKLKAELSDTEGTVNANKETIDKINDYKANSKKYDDEINTKKTTISSLDSEISTKNSEISAKKSELEKLTADVIKAKGAPKHLPAGEFIVGTDIESGRYSVTGRSNFVVYSSNGSLKVNTILGGGDWGVDQYVCNLETGDKINAASSCTYTPVQ